MSTLLPRQWVIALIGPAGPPVRQEVLPGMSSDPFGPAEPSMRGGLPLSYELQNV